MMKHHEAFATLRNVLAELYSDEASARRVGGDAGLDVLQIAFSTHAVNNWTAILTEAEKQAAITTIVRIAQKEYLHYQSLQDAFEAYAEAWVTDPHTPGARATELAYLEKVSKDYEYWAERYTPLAGIAEVRRVAQAGPHLEQPLRFMPTGFEKLAEHGFGPKQHYERVPVDDLRQAVQDVQRLVLLGEPGAGKTTTLWRLTYDFALAAQSDPQAPLPLFVPLGDYSVDEPALTFMQAYFGALAPYLPAYLRHQRVILMLDGINEMSRHSHVERVRRIQGLLDTYAKAAVVVTCRALDYIETLNLQKLEIKPLTPPRQLEYLQHYLGLVEGERLFVQMAGDEMALLWELWQATGASWQEFWTGEEMPVAVHRSARGAQRNLWAKLRQGELPPLWALGCNPFMLRMFAQVHAEGGGVLPSNRSRLFAAFVDTLLAREAKRHDATMWPGADAIVQCLTQLAFATQQAGERGTAVDEAWAIDQLTVHTADPTQALYLAASATLLDRSGGRVRFVHQLLQEYLAALALKVHFMAGENLRSYWPHGWTEPSGWEETMVLLAGLQPDLKPLVESLLAVHPVLAARVIVESGAPAPAVETSQAVQDALLNLTTSTTQPARARNLAGNALNLLGDPRPGVGLTPDGLPDIAWCDVPAGQFMMGNTRETDLRAFDDEAPRHDEPMLSAYRISRYPITNAQYDAFVQDGGYSERWLHCWTDAGWEWRANNDRIGPNRYGGQYGGVVLELLNHPLVGVTWYEAYAYCGWLSAKLGLAVSLPTEAQWEKAARGTDGRRYSWGSEITPDHINWAETDIGTTSPVGIFPRGASPYGVLDICGNVWEWCLTKWRSNYSTLADDSPQGDAERVVRGGSFANDEWLVRCAIRHYDIPSFCDITLGFRIVVSTIHPRT